MSMNSKKSLGWTMVLMVLGVAAFVFGEKSLFVLVPAATLIWYGAGPMMRSGRN